MDSGLVVVVFIISFLIIIVFSFLLFVEYEWCHVLFKNNTVKPIVCHKEPFNESISLLPGEPCLYQEQQQRQAAADKSGRSDAEE